MLGGGPRECHWCAVHLKCAWQSATLLEGLCVRCGWARMISEDRDKDKALQVLIYTHYINAIGIMAVA